MNRSSAVSIPTAWTAEQALLVTDFLEVLHQAIWEVYERQLIELIILRHDTERLDSPTAESPFGEDDIPF